MQSPRLLPWLTSWLVLGACSGVTQAHQPDSPSKAASSLTENARSDSPGHLSNQFADNDDMYNGPEILMVLDPNGIICWEEVDIDSFTNATLLQWLHRQQDALTMSDHDSIGEPLQASPCNDATQQV